MSGGPGKRVGPYVRLHWVLLDEFERAGTSIEAVGIYAMAVLASARYGRDGQFTVRDVARAVTPTAARKHLVELERHGFVRQIDREAWYIVGYEVDQMTEAAWQKRRDDAAHRQRVKRALDSAKGSRDVS